MDACTPPPPDDAQLASRTGCANGELNQHREERGASVGIRNAQHVIMFWVLTSMAFVIFAPCVLLPIWAETEAILEHEHATADVVAELKARVERNDVRIEALLTDPLVNERVARRQLNHRPEDAEIINLSRTEPIAIDLDLPDWTMNTSDKPQNQPPAWMIAARRWLPAWPWRELFVKSPNRSIMLLMAGGLFTTGFLLYGPVNSRSKGSPRSDPAVH